MADQRQTRQPTPEEDIRVLYKRVARLNDQVAALLNPEWGASNGILPEGHPLHPDTMKSDAADPQSEADPERLTATTAPCTASFRDVRGTVRACNQAAGHYDETREPAWPTPLGPPTPGGLHTDGESIWHDRADGATPHRGG